ncbi:MAG: nickel-dependent hydrogenase large subunit, partial [Oligoflexia bacterium]|nr:nickel-dependent hydrogenase large subunit [Oligoflexia bacterium]
NILSMKPLCSNPYWNIIAQAIELFNDIYCSIELLDEILTKGIKHEAVLEPTKFSRGINAVEVPRGILYHEYEYDKQGFCLQGNCVIPTAQNHANIQNDFDKYLPILLAENKSEKEIELALEMLVRAYDPCISCSTHYLKVNFV